MKATIVRATFTDKDGKQFDLEALLRPGEKLSPKQIPPGIVSCELSLIANKESGTRVEYGGSGEI